MISNIIVDDNERIMSLSNQFNENFNKIIIVNGIQNGRNNK